MIKPKTCALCGELIRPEHFGSNRACAFDPMTTTFRSDNWNCPVVSRFRAMALDAANEHMWRERDVENPDSPYASEIRDNDEGIVVLSLIELHVRVSRVGTPQAVLFRWYKDRGRTDGILFTYRDNATVVPTLTHVLEVMSDLKVAFPAWVAEFEERRHG